METARLHYRLYATIPMTTSAMTMSHTNSRHGVRGIRKSRRPPRQPSARKSSTALDGTFAAPLVTRQIEASLCQDPVRERVEAARWWRA
jgi:hypothetical protein